MPSWFIEVQWPFAMFLFCWIFVNCCLQDTGYIGYQMFSTCNAASFFPILHGFKVWQHPFIFSLSQQLGFKMFLGVTATVTNWDAEGTSCSLVLEDNPLVDFVELPDTCQGLQYCNLLSGVIRGALEMVGLLFNCYLHSSFFLYLSCQSYYRMLFWSCYRMHTASFLKLWLLIWWY